MKKRQDHSWDRGIIVTALGKAMKASPGPAKHSTAMWTPDHPLPVQRPSPQHHVHPGVCGDNCVHPDMPVSTHECL